LSLLITHEKYAQANKKYIIKYKRNKSQGKIIQIKQGRKGYFVDKKSWTSSRTNNYLQYWKPWFPCYFFFLFFFFMRRIILRKKHIGFIYIWAFPIWCNETIHCIWSQTVLLLSFFFNIFTVNDAPYTYEEYRCVFLCQQHNLI